MNSRALSARLLSGAARLGVSLDDGACATLTAFLDLLVQWNRAYNLTAVREVEEMLPRHLLDSLSSLPDLHGGTILDVGTGAGLPGIPLAVVCPQRSFTLLDSNGKKIRFVRHAVTELRIDNVEPIQQRAEDYRPGAGFDTVICRAFAPLPRIVDKVEHLCAPGGRIVALKGRHFEEEVAGMPPGWQVQSRIVDVPGVDAERHVLTLERGRTQV